MSTVSPFWNCSRFAPTLPWPWNTSLPVGSMKAIVPPSTVAVPTVSVAASRVIRPPLVRVLAVPEPLLMAIVPVLVSAA